MFRVADAQRDEGAVAVAADEDLEVRPDKVDGLRADHRGGDGSLRPGHAARSNLAYRYEGAGGKATIAVDRTKSRATARTFAFFQIVPDLLKAHYVVIYTIEDAKTRRLALLLPDSTPEALTIQRTGGRERQGIHQRAGRNDAAWNVLLDEARRGEVRLAVDFEMRRIPLASGRGAGREGGPTGSHQWS